MNAPDKCPKCGSAFTRMDKDDWGDSVINYARFICDTTAYEDGQLRIQGLLCMMKERDQLAARVADADRERDQALAVLGAYKMDKEALAARVKELEAYAKRLENAGDSCCIFGPDSVLKDWTAAKESKP